MSDEQINIAIFEIFRWKWETEKNSFFHPENGRLKPKDAPDFCNDLNAMHEGERSLNSQQVQDYTLNLLRVTNNDGTRFHGTLGCFAHVHATAKQRAEAFLKTIGKWEDAK
jgi:hypothetical protein